MKKNASKKLDNFKNYSFKSLNVIVGGTDDDGDIEKKKLKQPGREVVDDE